MMTNGNAEGQTFSIPLSQKKMDFSCSPAILILITNTDFFIPSLNKKKINSFSFLPLNFYFDKLLKVPEYAEMQCYTITSLSIGTGKYQPEGSHIQ